LPVVHWASVAQVVAQEADVPPQVYGAQDGLPPLPAGTTEQVPTLPLRLHASQAPPHAVLQQTPSAQLPELH
jgi:hypothetical protein